MKIAIIFALCILLSLAIASASNISWEPAVVVSVSGNEVEIETADGNRFIFFADGLKSGDEIYVEFDTNRTKDRKDDRIIAAKMR